MYSVKAPSFRFHVSAGPLPVGRAEETLENFLSENLVFKCLQIEIFQVSAGRLPVGRAGEILANFLPENF